MERRPCEKQWIPIHLTMGPIITVVINLSMIYDSKVLLVPIDSTSKNSLHLDFLCIFDLQFFSVYYSAFGYCNKISELINL
jgi:hypothetical protein